MVIKNQSFLKLNTQWVDDDCLLTLNQLRVKVADVYNIQVSNSCIDRVLRNFHYTIKVDTIPDARNRSSTIEQRFKYSIRFRDLEQEIPIENFIFVDEVGFSRPKRGRAVAGQRATTPVPFSRSRNISVVAAMTKNGMLYNKVHDTAVTGQDFQLCLDEIKNICIERNIKPSNHFRQCENTPQPYIELGWIFTSISITILPILKSNRELFFEVEECCYKRILYLGNTT